MNNSSDLPETTTSALNKQPITLHAISLLLPTAANMTVVPILSLILSGILTRTDHPDAAIGGFAIALGISMFVGLPQLRIQQLTLVFLEDDESLRQLRKFIGFWVLLVTTISSTVVLPPVSEFLLREIFSISGLIKQNASQSLIWLIPLPGLLIFKMYFYGTVLRISRPKIAWIGTSTGAATVIATAFALFLTGVVQGASIAAIALITGTLIEATTLAVLSRKPIKQFIETSSSRIKKTSIGSMATFFWPLLFAAMLPAGTQPILNAGMARSPEPEVSIAAVALAFYVFQLIAVATNGTQNTALALFASGYAPLRVRKFVLFVGLITFVVVGIIAYTPQITQVVIGDIMGAKGRLNELATTGFRILAILPIALVVEQLYTAALMRTRETRPIIYINALRLLTLTVWVIGTVNFTDLNGLWVGSGAWTLTLLSESIYAYIFGRKNLNKVN
tara:strand:- start:1555 stop:2901 length:1347 start_codon:yes stop_codon:yes gene_type:complete